MSLTCDLPLKVLPGCFAVYSGLSPAFPAEQKWFAAATADGKAAAAVRALWAAYKVAALELGRDKKLVKPHEVTANPNREDLMKSARKLEVGMDHHQNP